MAALVCTIIKSLPGNQFILQALGAAGSEVADNITLPNGFGDCLILESFHFLEATTFVSLPQNDGISVRIAAIAGDVVNGWLGAAPWTHCRANDLATTLHPDGPVPWGTSNYLRATWPAPGGASYVDMHLIRVRSLRQDQS